jgi:hypothetical protein
LGQLLLVGDVDALLGWLVPKPGNGALEHADVLRANPQRKGSVAQLLLGQLVIDGDMA